MEFDGIRLDGADERYKLTGIDGIQDTGFSLMKLGEYTEDEFYPLVEEGMEQAIDRVASPSEWTACKGAIYRWIEKWDAEVARGEADAQGEREARGR